MCHIDQVPTNDGSTMVPPKGVGDGILESQHPVSLFSDAGRYAPYLEIPTADEEVNLFSLFLLKIL
jgi:hypothetical protein